MLIRITLPADRTQTGTLQVVSGDGEILLECPCLGKADNAAAAKAGNPLRDPEKQFGDTPLGRYECAYVPPSQYAPAERIRKFGPHGIINLLPLSGQAWKARESGRKGLAIHGGDPGAQGQLRPTHGCIRISNESMAALVRIVRGYRVLPGDPGIACEITSQVIHS